MTAQYQLVKNTANALTMDFMGVIGWSFDAQSVNMALNLIEENEPVVINMHSPGGNLGDSIAIKNMLLAHRGEVTVNVYCHCLSGGPVIAMGADTVNMAPDAGMMIHRAWDCFCGHAEGMANYARNLNVNDRMMLESFKARGDKINLSDEELKSAIEAETWYTASDAIEAGLADAILDPTGFEVPESIDIDPDAIEQLVLPTSTPETVLAQLGVKRQPSGLLTMTKAAQASANAPAAKPAVAPVENTFTQDDINEATANAQSDMQARFEKLMPYAQSKGMEWVSAQAAKTNLNVDDIIEIAGEPAKASVEPVVPAVEPAAGGEPKPQASAEGDADLTKIAQDAAAAAVQAVHAQASTSNQVPSGSSEGGQPAADSDEALIAKAQAAAHAANVRNGTAQPTS